MKIQDKIRACHTFRWSNANTARHQTVAEHSWAVAIIADEFCDRMEVDGFTRRNVMLYAVYHDIAEGVLGDVLATTKKRLNGEINALEKELIDGMEGAKPPTKASNEVLKIVKVADRIEALAFISENGVGKHAEKITSNMLSNFKKTYSTAEYSRRFRLQAHTLLNDIIQGEVML
jgi:5'-deoxynucleotidase YfbR-like HD superfamily hydrolase